MRKICIAVAFALAFAASSLAQGTCTRQVEAVGGFSYCPPASWIAKDSPSGDAYKVYVTPAGSAVLANMNVKDEATAVAHNEYLAAALKILLADNPGKGDGMTKVIGWTDFTSDSNIRGSRLIYQRLYKEIPLRTVQYIFDLPGKKLILTGTAREADKETTDMLFDAAARTLRLGR